MNYPSRIITRGEKDAAIVQGIQIRLNELGCGPVAVDGVFGKKTADAIKDFQSRHCDVQGNPLVIYGEVGIHTWAGLFGAGEMPGYVLSPLIVGVLKIAENEIGVCEVPPASVTSPTCE